MMPFRNVVKRAKNWASIIGQTDVESDVFFPGAYDNEQPLICSNWHSLRRAAVYKTLSKNGFRIIGLSNSQKSRLKVYLL